MNIPGIKEIRLLAQQPVALLPGKGVDATSERLYFIEVTFESGGVLNVPCSRYVHDTWIMKLKEQGTSLEQRVSARPSVALPDMLGTATQETFLPLDRPLEPGEAEKALRDAVAADGEPPPSSSTANTIPAAPLALRPDKHVRVWSSGRTPLHLEEPPHELAQADELEPPTPKREP